MEGAREDNGNILGGGDPLHALLQPPVIADYPTNQLQFCAKKLFYRIAICVFVGVVVADKLCIVQFFL